jgi:hypothetical protein
VSGEPQSSSGEHILHATLNTKYIIFNHLALAGCLLFMLAGSRESGGTMETILQGMVVIGGLTFSLAVSLLIEELIFGQIVRRAFAPRPENSASGRQER